MSKAPKHIGNTVSRYLDYFKGLLSGSENHLLEKRMMQDTFEEEAFDGMAQLEPDALKDDLLKLNQQIEHRTQKKARKLIYFSRYAAAIALLITIGGILLLMQRKQLVDNPIAEEASESIREKHELRDAQSELINPPEAEREVETSEIHPAAMIDPVEDETTTKPIEEEKEKSIAFEEPLARNEEVEIQPLARLSKKPSKQDNLVPEISIDNPKLNLEETSTIEIRGVATNSENKEESIIEIDQTLSGKLAGISATPSAKMEQYDTNLNTYKYISGQVVDMKTREPLPGVNVILKGTSFGTITDTQGRYKIEVPDSDQTLQFAYIGFSEEEVEISNKSEIDVNMSADLMALEEVVVVGYGAQKKRDVAGSASRVDIDTNPESQLIIKPAPEIGMGPFKSYIKSNIRYNELPPIEKNVIVKLKFTITVENTVQDILILKSGNEEFNEEAKRLLLDGPKWIAGSINGIPTQDEVIVRIKFEAR